MSQSNFSTPPTTAARTNFSGDVGYFFTNTKFAGVSQLGRLYVAGNSQNHNVYLWDSTTQKIVSQGTILAASASDGAGYKWVNVTPVTLIAGRSYLLMCQEFSGGDAWKDSWTPPTGGALQSGFSTTALAFITTTGTYPPGGNITSGSAIFDTVAIQYINSDYSFSGPTAAIVGSPMNYQLVQASSTSTTVTPSDGGAGGTFLPTSLSWASASGEKDFTYMPASAGAVTITVTSSASALADPMPITATARAATVASSIVPNASPGWTGTANSGWGNAVPIVEPTRTTGKPTAQFDTVPYDDCTGTKTIAVLAYAKGGIAKVRFFVEGNAVDVSAKSKCSYYAGLPYEGYQLSMDMTQFKNASNTAIDGTFNIYAEVWPTDTALQRRVISLTLSNNNGGTLHSTVKYVDQTSTITGVRSAAFTDRETVTQATSGATATVIASRCSATTLTISTITGTPNSVSLWTGGTSGSTFVSSSLPIANGSDSNNGNTALTPYATDQTARYASGDSSGDVGGGICYYLAGDYKFGNDSEAFNVLAANRWYTFTPAPGVTKADVRIVSTGSGGAGVRTQKVHLKNLTLPLATIKTSGFSPALWMDNISRFAGGRTVTNTFFTNTSWTGGGWATDCSVTADEYGFSNGWSFTRNCVVTAVGSIGFLDVGCIIQCEDSAIDSTGTAFHSDSAAWQSMNNVLVYGFYSHNQVTPQELSNLSPNPVLTDVAFVNCDSNSLGANLDWQNAGLSHIVWLHNTFYCIVLKDGTQKGSPGVIVSAADRVQDFGNIFGNYSANSANFTSYTNVSIDENHFVTGASAQGTNTSTGAPPWDATTHIPNTGGALVRIVGSPVLLDRLGNVRNSTTAVGAYEAPGAPTPSGGKSSGHGTAIGIGIGMGL